MYVMEAASWSAFETLVNEKRLLMQYVEDGQGYDVFAPEAGSILWRYRLLKDGGADVEDFEDNHKATANQPCGVAHSPFSSGEFEFAGDSAGPLTVTAGQSATSDYEFTETLYIDGGMIYAKDGAVGDYIKCEIIDIDNILGLGANTILKTYIKKWFIKPNEHIDIQTPYAGRVQQGLYMRVTYTSTGGTNVTVFGNFRLHRKIA